MIIEFILNGFKGIALWFVDLLPVIEINLDPTAYNLEFLITIRKVLNYFLGSVVAGMLIRNFFILISAKLIITWVKFARWMLPVV